ncbi:sensor histidine kinase [Paludifilum halophilum]|nr:HAMP domain-containing sensor histidine kinase [Paludifilum halophilum]
MPIKWRLSLLSSLFLLMILIFFHGFVYKLFEGMIIQTEQNVLEHKLSTLSDFYRVRDVNPSLRQWLQPFVDQGQAIRVTGNGSAELEINRGVSRDLYLPENSRQSVKEVKNVNGRQVSILALPLQGGGRVEMYTDFTFLNRYLDTMLSALMIGSSVLLVTVVIGGYIMSSIALNPVKRIVRTVCELDASRLDSRLHVPDTRDEIEMMSRTFNKLLDEIYGMMQKQRQFVADASHELRTPVSVIRGYTNLLSRWGKEDPQVMQEALDAIDQETERMERLTSRLLRLARLESAYFDQEGRKEGISRVNLNKTTDQRISHWKNTLKQRKIEWMPEPDSLTAEVYPSDWEDLIDILLDNAGKYSDDGDLISLKLFREGDMAVFIVRNTGAGIPADELPQVFHRFYRVKIAEHSRPGSGLGLSIAKEVVEKYGGDISIDSRWGEWTEVCVKIPLSH